MGEILVSIDDMSNLDFTDSDCLKWQVQCQSGTILGEAPPILWDAHHERSV